MSKKLEEYTKEELIQMVQDLKGGKKFGLVWEDKPEQVAIDCETKLPVLQEVSDRAVIKDKEQPTNLILEGDNYHALSVLNYTHAKSVDVVYIDPPYNTEDTKWIYNNNYVDKNDAYRHSKWLSFMHKRLVLSKGVLKDDGVLICAIDKNEQAHLEVMLEGLFANHEIHTVTVVHNPRGVQGTNFSYTHEYAIFVIPKGKKSIGHRKIDEKSIDWRNLRDNGGESLREDARNCFYPIIIKDGKIIGFGEVVPNEVHPDANAKQKDGSVYVYPIDVSGIERKWRYARQSVDKIKDLLRAKQSRGIWQIELGKNFGTYRTVWQDARYDANEFGTKLINKIVPKNGFDFPKSLWTTYDCIYAAAGDKKDAVVLDYFAGSGTTGHAVLQMNKEDGGNRNCILVSSSEGDIPTKVTFPRIKGVIEGYADVAGIPSNVRYFKTDFVDKKKTNDQTRLALIERCTDMIRVRENAFEFLVDEEKLKLLSSSSHNTAIIFDPHQIEKFFEQIEDIDHEKPLNAYIFSYSSYTYDEDIPETKLQYTLCPIPESILEVYRRIFREEDNV